MSFTLEETELDLTYKSRYKDARLPEVKQQLNEYLFEQIALKNDTSRLGLISYLDKYKIFKFAL